jgi:hypothetical protein
MPSGKVNPVSLVLILAVIGGIWAAIDLAPAYLDQFDVDEAVASAVNTAGKGGWSDEQLTKQLLGKLGRVGKHWEEDSNGEQAELLGLGLTEDNVTIERDTVANRISIVVEYDRMMQLAPLKRLVKLHFSSKGEGAIPP